MYQTKLKAIWRVSPDIEAGTATWLAGRQPTYQLKGLIMLSVASVKWWDD
jgi:hypothetical protein